MKLRLLAATFVVSVALVGCDQAPPSTERLQQEVFGKSCNFSGCHKAGGSAGGLDLESPEVRARLLDTEAKGVAGKKLVVASSLEQSYLWEKVSTEKPANGTQMPPGQPLSAEQQAMLRAWIEAGALP